MSSILLMNNGYPTKNNPSYASYIKSIKEGIEAAGNVVSLLVLNADFKNKKEQILAYIKYYREILKTDFSKYDYVLINHYGHFAIPMLRKLSSIKQPVIHWHGEDLYPKNKIADKLFSKLAQYLPAKTLHISPSDYFKNKIAAKLKISPSKIYVSPSGGVDTNTFSCSERNQNRNTIKLGFASGLVLEKGIELVLELMKNNQSPDATASKKIELHYINYGKHKVKYYELLKQYSNTVCWNSMPSQQMPEFYQSIDVLLFPTFREQESLGLVALEAMSCCKPVLAPDAFAAKEYVVSGISGELFKLNSYEDFYNKLMQIINNITDYNPRTCIMEKYSKEAVIKFYRYFFK